MLVLASPKSRAAPLHLGLRIFSCRDIPKAETFLPFLMSWTRTHLRMAELGCLASTPTFSRTMPLACDEPFRIRR